MMSIHETPSNAPAVQRIDSMTPTPDGGAELTDADGGTARIIRGPGETCLITETTPDGRILKPMTGRPGDGTWEEEWRTKPE